MQVYYFTRTGRSEAVALQIAEKYGVCAERIDDHRDWQGNAGYAKAGMMATLRRSVPADYMKPDLNDDIVVVFPLWAGTMPPAVRTFVDSVGREHTVAVVTSLGSTLKDRKGFRKVIDLVGQELTVPEHIL